MADGRWQTARHVVELCHHPSAFCHDCEVTRIPAGTQAEVIVADEDAFLPSRYEIDTVLKTCDETAGQDVEAYSADRPPCLPAVGPL
jgi:hypothetical protein